MGRRGFAFLDTDGRRSTEEKVAIGDQVLVRGKWYNVEQVPADKLGKTFFATDKRGAMYEFRLDEIERFERV